jgi:S1-C subfamily serine protease
MGGTFERRLAALATAVIIAFGTGSAARAEDWVPAAKSTAGDLYEVDASTVGQTGSITETWVRYTPAHPVRDANAGKSFVLEIDKRYDDCQNRRYQISQVTRRDRQGNVVSTGATGLPWADVVPSSVAEGISRVTCRLTQKVEERPLLDDIMGGKWILIGPSADRTYSISVLFDRIIKLDQDHVVVLSRSDYADFDRRRGYPIKYIITANVVDCAHSRTAMYGMDAYMTASVRAEAYRAPGKPASFEPIVPGSFLASSFKQICASAVPLPKDEEQASQPGQMFTGTAWGVSKGYLVTASHVIKDGVRIAVYSDGQPVGAARVVADDPASDIAILKLAPLKAGQLAVLSLAGHGAELGKSVFTLGYPEPDTLGQLVKMTAGEVSGTRGMADNARLLQISVPIQPGNSGGPVLGWDGSVVGMADSSIPEFRDAPSQNVNYAVKASYVRAMLEDLPDLGNYVLVKQATSHEEMVTAARKAVFMLVVTQ